MSRKAYHGCDVHTSSYTIVPSPPLPCNWPSPPLSSISLAFPSIPLPSPPLPSLSLSLPPSPICLCLSPSPLHLPTHAERSSFWGDRRDYYHYLTEQLSDLKDLEVVSKRILGFPQVLKGVGLGVQHFHSTCSTLTECTHPLPPNQY